MHDLSKREKARVNRRRPASVEYYYPFRDCLLKCFPKLSPAVASIEDTSTGTREQISVSPIIKYALFFVNVLFWLGSLLLVGVGCWALATKELDGSKRITSAWDFIFDVTIIFIVVGCSAFVLASCACIGALRENVCLLRTYWVSLIILDLILVIVGLVGLCMWSRFLTIAKLKLSKELVLNYDDDPDLKDLMDFVQEKFECCGISDDSYIDWNRNIYFNCTTSNKDPRSCGVPHSCCRPEVRGPKAIQRIYTIGCVQAMENSIKSNILLFCLVSLAMSLIPLVGIFLALSLTSQIEYQRLSYDDQRRQRDIEQSQRYVITVT